jgi:diguanylate cyclase (GGDEF)-like protein
MMSYPLTDDETLRLRALRALQIVGTPSTVAFDAIAKLAADTFTCPIAFVSLLDKDEQWFKAEYGLGTCSTPREIAFCNHTILGSDVFIVEDTRCDERFASNPLVTGQPHIRFYAGVPIAIESGFRIGALCVSDRRPCRFSEADVEKLRQLGQIVEGLMAAHDQFTRAATAAHDVAEKAALLQLLWKKNRLLRQVERIGKIGGWELDLKTNKVEWSDEVSRIHELPTGVHYQLEEALSFYPEPWRSLVMSNVEKTKATGESYDFESQFVTASGHKKWVRAAGDCEQQDGVPIRLFGMFQDITQEKAASDLLWNAANFDELTGLANRHHFNRALEAAIEHAAKAAGGVALMIVDLDNFKEVNDTRGHAVGDEILIEVARRLGRAAPSGSVVARLGGDEFAIIISGDCSSGRLEKSGKQILAALKDPIRIGTAHVYITGSLGIARYPDDANNSLDLLKAADLGLYSAKRVDRGSIKFYSQELAALLDRHAQSVEMVRGALARRRLVPFYQPKVRLDNNRCYGFEALVRILGNDGSILSPATFAPALQDREMARRIGKRMLRAVTADMASWRAAGLDTGSVSLNVGEADFADGKLADHVLQRLDALSLPHSCLTIEVTESVFLGDEASLARDALTRLDAEGIKIELDDFGTGYASLTHLRAFPISRLKIDLSFIRDLGRDDDSRIIVQAVIDLGHNLNFEIVAEGVETEFQAGLLRNMGCDMGQGYLFGRPASAKQTRNALKEEMPSQRLRPASAVREGSGAEVPQFRECDSPSSATAGACNLQKSQRAAGSLRGSAKVDQRGDERR